MTVESSYGGYTRTRAAGGEIRLDLNEAPREADEAFRRRLLEILAARSWRRYPDMDLGTFRAAAAELYGWEAAGTLAGNGSNELLAAAVRLLLPRGGRLFSLAPSFSMYPVLAGRMGAELVTLGLPPPSFVVDREALLDLASGCDLVLLCSPNNPTGGELGEGIVEEVLATGKPVVWDAAYADFSGVDPRPLLRRHPNLMVLRSLSKAWGLAGLRVGALLAGPDLVQRVSGELLPFDSGWLVGAAFQAACELRATGVALVAEITAERERELAAIAGMPGLEAVPSAGNFYLLRRTGWTGSRLVAAVRERGVLLRDIAELDEAGYVRVTVGTRDEGDVLLGVLREVSGA
ncbi:MAG: histidinol-phosphate aminotransferase family protein [Acidobacteria bacterium]|nr:histidinol-phosphate aminotransferase family protein [Acidobacteriota bacterium]